MSDDIRKKRKRQTKKGRQLDEAESPRVLAQVPATEESPKTDKVAKEQPKVTKAKQDFKKEVTPSYGGTKTVLITLISGKFGIVDLYVVVIVLSSGLVLFASVAIFMGQLSFPLDAASFSRLGADCVFPNHQNIQLHIDDVKKLVDDAAKQLPTAEQLKRFVEASFGVSQMVGTDNGESEEALNTRDVKEQLDITETETEYNLNEKPNESLTKQNVEQTSSNKVSSGDSNKASVQNAAPGDL